VVLSIEIATVYYILYYMKEAIPMRNPLTVLAVLALMACGSSNKDPISPMSYSREVSYKVAGTANDTVVVEFKMPNAVAWGRAVVPWELSFQMRPGDQFYLKVTKVWTHVRGEVWVDDDLYKWAEAQWEGRWGPAQLELSGTVP